MLLADGSYTLSGGTGELSLNASGQLVQAVDASGNRAQYQYTDGRLTRVETSSGVRIDLSYDAGRISQVTSGTRTLYYQYDGRGDLVEASPRLDG